MNEKGAESFNITKKPVLRKTSNLKNQLLHKKEILHKYQERNKISCFIKINYIIKLAMKKTSFYSTSNHNNNE